MIHDEFIVSSSSIAGKNVKYTLTNMLLLIL